jgi:hypothetical protein
MVNEARKYSGRREICRIHFEREGD